MKSLKRILSITLFVSVAAFWALTAAFAADVMTVLGPVPVDKLGFTLMHEHLAFAYPGWSADESVAPYDRKAIEQKSLKFLNEIKELGVKTWVEPAMNDVGGRDPILMKNLAKKTGLNMIVSTGMYWEGEGTTRYYKWNQAIGRNIEDDFYELFKRELTVGIGKTGVKAGLVKLASGDPAISDYEKIVFKAGVRAAKDVGVSITTHCQGGTVGLAQQDLFLSLGANPKRIIIGHQNNSIDLNYHLAQLQRPDFYIGFDRTSLGDPKAEDCLIELIKRGYANRLTVSHDYVGTWLGRPFNMKALPATWYPTYIHKVFIPKAKAAGVTDEQLNTIFVENPRRFFTGE